MRYWFFYHMFLYVQEGLQRVRCLTHQTIKIKTVALYNWNMPWSTSVLVQQVLVVYWENSVWKENHHNVIHALCGQSVCSNHCVLQFPACVALCHAEMYVLLTLIFAHLIGLVWKVSPSVKFISSNHSSSTTTIIYWNN